MRHQGKISVWKDDRGFGFITPQNGGAPVFLHIRNFSNPTRRRPVGNEPVTYELRLDATRRPYAENVIFTGDGGAPELKSGGGAIGATAFSIFFLTLIGVAALADKLPRLVLPAYLTASAVAFLMYRRDKYAARNGEWRTPENSLHLLALAGGWPGALIAQRRFRHKSGKKSFQIVFWLTVLINCVAVFGYVLLASLD
jgi:uncharacterized membrane protein YsdA (DUF1294 family)/cold shock CspA family protein